VNGGTRQRNLLIALGVLLLVVAWRYLRPQGGGETPAVPAPSGAVDEEGGPARRPPPAAGPERRGAKKGDRVAVLRMADLDRVPPGSTVGRDPWRFVDPPPPPPPKPHVPTAAELKAMEEERQRQEAAARAAAEAAAIEAAKPKPPEFTMQYLGDFGPPNRKIAVFTDGKKIYNSLEGDVIDNKFIVAHIGYESVDIRYVNFPEVPAKRLGVGHH